MLKIFIVSDATGETAERVVRAGLVQFADAAVSFVRRRNVRTPEQIRALAQEAAAETSVIFHTLVSDHLRRVMLEQCRLHGVESLDMLGPVLERLAARLKLSPQERPGLFKQLTEAKSREIEAVEFAFRHDDGQNPEGLDRAEIVLVGVSRSMKTPTMLYLAYRGWYAANVPLVPGIPPPDSLVQFPKDRVFCLFMEPEYLLDLRKVRAEAEGIPLEGYATLSQVRRELSHAKQLCTTYGWWRMDVTGKSVEEVGQEIIALASKRKAVRKTDG
jgi:regulator of PEP synthase PpsR (kinase-PPPase family)